MEENKELLVLSPFEIPDVRLALETIKAGAYPVMHLGRNMAEATKALDVLSQSTSEFFGVCVTSEASLDLVLPSNVNRVIFPFGVTLKLNKNVEGFIQIHSLEEAQLATVQGFKNIIVKGNEGAGKVANESSFILFQSIINNLSDKDINVYIQGGGGIHSSAAALALGAKGIIMDSQVALFPECSLPKELKELCRRLSGSETTVIDNFRVLMRNNSPILPPNACFADVQPLLGGLELSQNLIPMGQDIALSVDFVENYKYLKNLVSNFHKAAFAHLQQAKNLKTLQPQNKLAKDLNIKYPIAQGPMARVSDIPEFAKNVADAGALPFVAMSLSSGEVARDLVYETSNLLKDKVWGVGILGFIPAKIRDEQTKYILETKPSVVLIAGGRPSLAKPFVQAGIKVFLHVPSPALLDMFLKENSKNFIFEGRESGGHIGPLPSLVLWERQINRLLKEKDIASFSVFFAGGIHDAFSSAFVSIMSATLAAKGAKVGILMGSAYIYTKEAVQSGAIQQEFQNQAIAANETVILEAAPGQETRSLKSTFTDIFQEEKRLLQSQNLDSKEIWMKLEDLNLGRLRIASKGLERIGSDIVKLSEKEQAEKGLFMIGQVATLNEKVLTMDELHNRVTIESNTLLSQLSDLSAPTSKTQPLDVAIVGISCIFPDAHNIEEYWRNIVTGKNSVTEVPDSRWNKDLYYNPDTRDTDYVSSKWGGFIPTIDFDPVEFGMTPQSLASIEPTQLLSLLVAKQALADAGYTNLAEIDLDDTSVVFGAEGATELAASYGFRGYAKQVLGELPEELKNSLPRLNEDSFAGVLSNVISGRISNRLNLGGRNYTVDAACASSLAALDVGCQELFSRRSNMVLLGGADLHNGINDFLMFSCTHALSRKGYSASFDSDSDGIALGEGIGVLVLKRLEDAERDGNKIYAVIKGVGGSSDGKSLGMTAPNGSGQIKALKRAYETAGILPSQVEMVEGHGTGTVVGDRTELKALTDMFLDSGAIKGQSLLGSVKTQIGHAKCAAGIAGVIKTALSIYYGVQPPTLHINNPNPFYDKDSSPFVFNKQAGMWNSAKRIAGVSAFGFGGTNFHVVMENHSASSNESALPLWPSELFVFRGDSLDEAKQQLSKLKQLLDNNDKLSIRDIAYSLAVYNNKEVQISIVASSFEDLYTKVQAALSGAKQTSVYFKNTQEGKVAFMFSGQGSQRINMARDLFVTFPTMRKLVAANREYEKILYPYATFDSETQKEQQNTITDTRNAQPTLGIVDYAIADFLRSLGIVPDMVAGHSYGELPALCFAGAFDENELVSLSRQRALAILDAVKEDKGKMLAVSLSEAEVKELLKDETEVWAVNFNSHKQIVLAGSTAGINALMQKMGSKNISFKELNVACAFHSPLLSDAQNLYARSLSAVDFKHTSLPVWSNTTADYYPTAAQEIKTRLCEHLVQPVLFTKQVENMYSEGARIFIETGPGRVLTGLVQSILKDDVVAIETENKNINGVEFLLQAIAKYISTGRGVDLEKLFNGRNASIIDLDNPDSYKKKATIWYINGHNAVPSNGKMPSNGAYAITQPVIQLDNLQMNNNNNTNSVSDQIMLEYLNGMKAMLQSQRDVMLGYLGYSAPASNTVISAPVQVQQVARPTITAPVETTPIVAQVVTPVTTVVSGPSLGDIKVILLDIVSEKTGYPTDMLGLDLDLEADLSIDSIKRMEIIGALREKLNISGSLEDSEDAIEKMAAVKTLNGLIAWIEELASANKPQSVAQSPAVQVEDVVVSQPTQSAAISVADIKVLLLDIVSEKTGYPTDMLGLDLDLEADLSIDSIKRMEIIGALREKLNISGSLEDSEDAIEKMAAVKTLNGLIGWIEELANGSSEDKNTVQQEATIEATTKEDEDVIRMSLELKEKQIDSSTQNLQIEGNKFALTNDGSEVAPKVKALLEKSGAVVDLIEGSEDLSSYDGIIILNSTNSSKKYDIKTVFNMIKSTDLTKVKWIYTFSDLLSNIKTIQNISELKDIQGFPGFIKSLAHEYPNINFRAVVSHSLFDGEVVPQMVFDELSVRETVYIEIVYKDNKRYCFDPKADVLSKGAASNLALDKDSLVVVFGGAQGITPELIYELSKEYPCHYILVGRSEKPSAEFDKYELLNSKDQIRKYLITEEQMRAPGEIEKKTQKIYKVNQIKQSIARIEKNGAKVTYESLDIKNAQALGDFIDNTYKTFGRIDGIFHAAGLLDDKLFANKTIESFDQVYSTKVSSLHVLLEKMRSDVKLFVMFSSVASAYGNRGQTDYASANSVFDLVAAGLNNDENTRFLTINWGPWKGTGMVSEALEAEFKKRGVPLIPLKEGAKYFVEELKYGKNTQVLVMGGSEIVTSF